jgi:hypothetical protein
MTDRSGQKGRMTMNEIKAEPHALNNVTQTSLRSPSPPWTRTAVLVVSLATLGLGPLPTQVAHAAQPTPVPCTVTGLLDAIHKANSGDTLSLFQNCTYTLTAADRSDSVLGDSGLVVEKTLTINGNGATISRSLSAPPFRIFLVTEGGDLTLNNVTVKNGNAATQDPKRGRGGGVYNLHKLSTPASFPTTMPTSAGALSAMATLARRRPPSSPARS